MEVLLCATYYAASVAPFLAFAAFPAINEANPGRERADRALLVTGIVLGSFAYLCLACRDYLGELRALYPDEFVCMTFPGIVGNTKVFISRSEEMARSAVTGLAFTFVGVTPWLLVGSVALRVR